MAASNAGLVAGASARPGVLLPLLAMLLSALAHLLQHLIVSLLLVVGQDVLDLGFRVLLQRSDLRPAILPRQGTVVPDGLDLLLPVGQYGQNLSLLVGSQVQPLRQPFELMIRVGLMPVRSFCGLPACGRLILRLRCSDCDAHSKKSGKGYG